MIVKVVTGLSEMTPAKKIEFGEGLEQGLTNNPLLPSEASAMKTLIHDKTDVLAKARGTYVKTRARADRDAALTAEFNYDLAVNTVALFVQGVANNDMANAVQIINSVGFRTTKKPEKDKLPETVKKAKAAFTNISGTILLTWVNGRFARFNDIYFTTDPKGDWTLIDSVEGRKLMVSALATGTKYYFRIVSRNRNGKSAPSEILFQIAA